MNTNDVYSIKAKLQPVLQLVDVYKVNDSWSVFSGLSISSSAYHLNYDYSTATFQYVQTFGINTTTIKLPINLQKNLTKRLSVNGGVAFNLQLHDSYSFATSINGGDSTAIEFWFDAPFKDYVTVSAQAGLAYRIKKRFLFTALFDFDMGKYPAAYAKHELTNTTTYKKTDFEFSGRPRFYSINLGINYKLW